MEMPKPPEDNELKNIIDKLANFVARNGGEFERLTKEKQKDNPKFSFLFGGENFNYYQYRVTSEQAIIKQQNQVLAQHGQPPPPQMWQTPPPGVVVPPPQTVVGPPPPDPQFQVQMDQLHGQIKQSEQNLAAQYQNLVQQQQFQIDATIRKFNDERLLNLCQKCDVNKEHLDRITQPIIEACTKDAISGGKNWIFSHNMSEDHAQLVAHYLFCRIISPEATFPLRLHLIYLINDVLHHCVRKNADNLKNALEGKVVPIFCKASENISEENQNKLIKLLNLWDQNKYFKPDILSQLRDPVKGMQNFQQELLKEHSGLVNQISQSTQSQYSMLQKQHQDFVNHVNSQISQIQAQQQAILQQQQQQPPQIQLPPSQQGGSQIPTLSSAPNSSGQQIPSVTSAVPSQPRQQGPPPPQGPPTGPQGPPPGIIPPNFNPSQPPPNFSHPPPGFSGPPPRFGFPGQPPPGGNAMDFNQGTGPGRSMPTPAIPLPDMSKPPPGFPPAQPPPNANNLPTGGQQEPDLTPSVPYFDLPGGLMAPLVKLEDSDYKPLDPKDIRLPPPMPPSERLLAAVEAFYSAPNHDRPRDSEGWEKLGLYEFFKAKEKARKVKEQKERAMRKEEREDKERRANRSGGARARSRSLSPRRQSGSRSTSRSPSPARKRRYNQPRRSSSRSPSKSPGRRRSVSRSPSPRRRKSRSLSASPRRRRRSVSRSPPGGNNRKRRSRSRSETPPGYSGFGSGNVNAPPPTRLGDENKGHQLLKKMGWGGQGLGASEQGIVDPIEAGEVRDRADMYKGIGVNMSDPFEQFRKNKSQGFIQRMKVKEAAALTASMSGSKSKKSSKS
ncbi:calcium homeostasis endoplasmic reticulum protein-like [Tubulanus polymorphus]|uniref:calcium homeostasis endoplasmic reticulum protein-like n=1 Tax=Tubulanus polymorphus TaxID=672921 RepID=UPI003DA5A355